MKIQAINISDQDKFPDQAGEYAFTGKSGQDGVFGMVFCCPCGCGDRACVDFDIPGQDVKNPKWTWDGNRDKPTLRPSLKKTMGCKWHGYLTNGMFRGECEA